MWVNPCCAETFPSDHMCCPSLGKVAPWMEKKHLLTAVKPRKNRSVSSSRAEHICTAPGTSGWFPAVPLDTAGFLFCVFCSVILWSWLLEMGNADRNAFGEWQWGAINALLTQFIQPLYPQLSSWANYYSGWCFAAFWALGKLVGRCVLKLHCLIMPLASSVGKIISDKPLSWVQSSKDAKRLGARWKVFDVNCLWHMQVWYVPGF